MDNFYGRHFYKFLKKECCLKSFIINIAYCEDNPFMEHNKYELETKGILNFLDNHHSISSAFLWTFTKEGNEFWKAKSDKWEFLLDKIRANL